MKIILGSASQGRKRMMKKGGYPFEVMISDLDEKNLSDRPSTAERLTMFLAHAKATSVLRRIREEAILITADQVVDCEGKILEKPKNIGEAFEHIMLCTRTARVATVTAVVVVNTMTRERHIGVDRATFRLRPFSWGEMEKLLGDDAALSCAGGISIENPLVAAHVEELEGAVDSVIGLPITLTKELMERSGFQK